ALRLKPKPFSAIYLAALVRVRRSQQMFSRQTKLTSQRNSNRRKQQNTPRLKTSARRLLMVSVASVVLALAALVFAAPGDLDTTFGTGGIVRTDFGGGDDF